MTSIGFIGGGNMAASLIGGLISSGFESAQIHVAEPDAGRRTALKQQYGIATTADNLSLRHCDTLVLAVKPQIMQGVCRQLASGDAADRLTDRLYISIAAGIRSHDIDQWLGGGCAIVRCMPNTPAQLRCGASGLYANARVSATQQKLAEDILGAVGMVRQVDDEALLDAVTAVSGSGPAYFFLLMEAMQAAGTRLGLDADTARELVIQTALGAARMAAESSSSPAELRQQVTSRGGTTAAAIASFQQRGFEETVAAALTAAHERSQQLAEELAKAESTPT